MTAPHPAAAVRVSRQVTSDRDRCPWCGQPVAHNEFEAIQAKIAAQEHERTIQFERELREKVALERLQIESRVKAQVDKANRTASAAVEKVKQDASRQLTVLKTNAEIVLNGRLRQEREALEKAHAKAVDAEKAAAFKERQRFENKVAGLQRQLQHKTADELGEGAEVDLFEELKAAFPDDRLSRVPKGTAGADIIHEITYNNRVCGRILYDSKNREAWRNEYVTKLRQDQLAMGADHAVLSTRVFPAGTQQIHSQDGVIIANPARVIDLVQILRRQVVVVDALRMSAQARSEKTALLYEFITSERCTQLFEQFDTLTGDLLELDVKEKTTHDNVWKQRGALLRSAERAHATMLAEIEQIIGTAAREQSA
ncbi:MAG: DUF2130 domain-containing protein [Candidatus Dormibacteraeota bacterium]|nr:DUF2130 domain-containing protein [Candidatus Dormibacteraeota bacterium]